MAVLRMSVVPCAPPQVLEVFLVTVNAVILLYLVAWLLVETRKRIREIMNPMNAAPSDPVNESEDQLQQLVLIRMQLRELVDKKGTMQMCNNVLSNSIKVSITGTRGAVGRKGPRRRLDRQLEEVAKAVGGGYCRLQMPLRLALAVTGDGGWA